MTRRIAVCDAETDPFKRSRVPAPFVWGFYDGDNYEEFSSTEDFVARLMQWDGICYAHNGGRFDWHFLLDYCEEYDELMLINGRISKMSLGLCECRDSINIIPVGLGTYKKDDIDYAMFEVEERNKPKNKAAISAYLRNDCIYLRELVTRFITDYGLQLTQAGAAMKQWVKLSKRAAPQTNEEFYNALSPYYYGGRVECFESGILEDEYTVFDINSAYPFAMLQMHPYSDTYGIRAGYHKNADFLRVRCISHGAFPFRGLGVSNGKQVTGLQFPRDDVSREYTVTKWEYFAALDTETIHDVTVIESIGFDGHTDFSDYINYFYEKRAACNAANDVAGSLFCKLLMNSLYGKFAANPQAYKNYMIVPPDVVGGLPKLGWTYSGDFGPWALAESPLDEDRQRYYNVATGASITGYVRAMLWRAICASKGVVYCDTDSITCRDGSTLECGKALGQWKHEGQFDRLGIAGKKLYIMRGAVGWWENAAGKTVQASKKPEGGARLYKTASKGAKLTHSQLWAVAKGGNVEYVPIAPTFSPKKKPVFTKRKLRFTA